jgi:hypothetical protein
MNPNILKKSSPRFPAAVILFIFSYLSSPAVYSQDFSSIDQDLAQLQLSARYAQSSKFWKTFTIVAIPVTAVISGVVGFALSR